MNAIKSLILLHIYPNLSISKKQVKLTVLNCRAVAIKWRGCGGGRGFSSNLRIGVQSEMTLWNFGNLALKWGSLIKWRANLFFVLSVVLRCFGFLIIWSTWQNVSWVSFFCVCSSSFYVNIIAEKSFLLCSVLAILF